MRKNAIQTKLLLTGLIVIPGLFGSVQAATPFVPATPPIVGYVAQPALTNYNFATGLESVFRGDYERGNWSGNLSCYPISNTGTVNTASPCWTSGTGATLKVGAQSQVDLQGFASGSRNIATLNTTGAPVAFTLAADPVNLVDAIHVNFIRGDRSQEAGATPSGPLRTRSSALGDVIHSRPLYKTDKNGANPTVFYGGNDGMLHAIDATQATGGRERWAYIPSMLIPKLKNLWASPYVHQDYVDGNVNIINAGTSATPRNILVGALGAGGQGLYALDVTSLTATSDTDVVLKFLWEITPSSITTRTSRAASTSYANLGHTYSNPVLVPVSVSGSTVNAMIVGNGYNNTGNGHATLLVIDVLSGTKLAEIDTASAGGTGTPASPNGLSTPVVVLVNGVANTVYAGDIDGNMWKFDLSNSTPGLWTAKLFYSTKANPATPAGQAITMKPAVTYHPYGGYMVNFVTGRILTAADALDTGTYYVYGIWDGAPAANSGLVTQTITQRQYTPSLGAASVTVRVVGAKPADAPVVPNWNSGGNVGWMAALPVGGERVIGDSAFDQFGRFFFNSTNPTVAYTYTYTPTTPTGAKPVTVSGNGVNWLMELDQLSGGNAGKPFFDMNSDGLLNDADRVQYVAGDAIPAPSVAGNPIMTSFGIPVSSFTYDGVQSQPALGVANNIYNLFFNANWDVTPTASTTSSTLSITGVGGGHFDADMFLDQNGGVPPLAWAETDHQHEYDKIYDVNGINFLNSNDPTENLANAIDPATASPITPTTPYKVLLMNQSWNRSMFLTLGNKIWSTKDYLTGPYKVPDPVTGLSCNPLSGCYNASYATLWTPVATGVGALKMSSLPTYTGISSTVTAYTTAPSTAPTPIFGRITVTNVSTTGSIGCGGSINGVAVNPGCTATSVTTGVRQADAPGGVGGFELSMPSAAFQIKDWWGDGVKQTGVMPTFYACPDASNADGTEPLNRTRTGGQYSGTLLERNDGVITVQVVKDTTPDSAVQLNVLGRPDLGFRVMDTQFQTYVMAEYVIYWHHPNTVCYGDTSSTWRVTNNQSDPWWPTQATSNNPATSGATTFGTKPDGTPLLCYPNQQSGSGSPAWISATPGSTWTSPATAWTTPPGWPPVGFTMTPPMDTATTLPPCPTYNPANDDPRTASFVSSSPGTGGTSTVITSSTTLMNLPVMSIGGMATTTPCVGSSCPSTGCVGAACQTTCVGTACSTPTTTPCNTPSCNQTGGGVGTGRLSWHELIHQ